MKTILKYLFIVLPVVAMCCVGCETTNTTTATRSSVAKLSAFSFAANDSFPGLAEATFKVEERLDTGIVYNVDSIRYGTPLDSVVPKFSFAITPGAAILSLGDTSVVLSANDTLDFTRRPIYLTITSQDASNTKVYEIVPSVHQVDPDLFSWSQLCSAIYPSDNSEQRVLLLDDKMVVVKNNGFLTSVYTSQDGAVWSAAQTPTGLPNAMKVRGIVSDNANLYYIDQNVLYTSTDALSWSAQSYASTDMTLKTMLLAWNNTVWALAEDANGLVLVYMDNGAFVKSDLRPKTDFPVSSFAAVAFASASNRARAMILGGYSEDGAPLNTRWNIEYVSSADGKGSYRMQDFSIDRPSFASLTGASVIWYNHALYLFGGVDEQMQYTGRDILISEDEGVSWTRVDTTKCQLPEAYTARYGQSVLVRDNVIYVVGGESQTESFSDVYRGKLNSIDWE